MILSENWLREWVNPDLDSVALADHLTMLGLEVDSLLPVAKGLCGVVVAEILTADPHPNADRLRVCKVNNGNEIVQIVCGAPNALVGLKAPLAKPGAQLPGGAKIKKAKLRGVASEGMLCSPAELCLSEDQDGLLPLSPTATVGQSILEYFDLDDYLIEIALTPNRADCLSVLGVARDLAVATDATFKNFVTAPVTVGINDTFSVRVDSPDKCPRYLGRVIRNIDISRPTPVLMAERLRRCGIRSVDPVVDVTNYVMLELGQPLHAFDLDSLEGELIVREAFPAESIILLNGDELALTTETLVIADARKPLAVAGIMGGRESGVHSNSRHLFLEAAFFTPDLLAGRARHFGLQTDASYRFERGVDPNLCYRAIERATALLVETLGGEAGPVIDISEEQYLPKRKPSSLRRALISRTLGIELPNDEVFRILTGLGFEVVLEDSEDSWTCTPPSWRFDQGRPADLIEELARIHGYENVPLEPLNGMSETPQISQNQIPLSSLRNKLVARGYSEAITFSFVSRQDQQLFDSDVDPVGLKNPISSDLDVMRTSLIPGLINALAHNAKRQISRVRLFEIGLIFFPGEPFIQNRMLGMVVTGSQFPEGWSTRTTSVDFYDLKGEVELLFSAASVPVTFRPVTRSGFHDGQTAEVIFGDTVVGIVGCIHPLVAEQLNIPLKSYAAELDVNALMSARQPLYQEISRHPEVRRDISIIVDRAVTASQVQSVLDSAVVSGLVTSFIFDVYQGPGIVETKKSFAVGLTFRDQTRTLSDQDVASAVSQVVDSLTEKLGAKLRS